MGCTRETCETCLSRPRRRMAGIPHRVVCRGACSAGSAPSQGCGTRRGLSGDPPPSLTDARPSADSRAALRPFGVARLRAVPVCARHRLPARIGARALPVGRARAGDLGQDTALVRNREHRGRGRCPRRGVGTRGADRPGDGRERGSDRALRRRAGCDRRDRRALGQLRSREDHAHGGRDPDHRCRHGVLHRRGHGRRAARFVDARHRSQVERPDRCHASDDRDRGDRRRASRSAARSVSARSHSRSESVRPSSSRSGFSDEARSSRSRQAPPMRRDPVSIAA